MSHNSLQYNREHLVRLPTRAEGCSVSTTPTPSGCQKVFSAPLAAYRLDRSRSAELLACLFVCLFFFFFLASLKLNVEFSTTLTCSIDEDVALLPAIAGEGEVEVNERRHRVIWFMVFNKHIPYPQKLKEIEKFGYRLNANSLQKSTNFL